MRTLRRCLRTAAAGHIREPASVIIDYRCGAGGSRLNCIRLVHPWGARTRGNGREPEATGRRFHAQDGGSCVIERGGLTVQLPPRARVTGPGSLIRGFVHFGVVVGCPRCSVVADAAA